MFRIPELLLLKYVILVQFCDCHCYLKHHVVTIAMSHDSHMIPPQPMQEDYEEFEQWLKGLSSDKTHPYLDKIIATDLNPCLSFRNTEVQYIWISWHFLPWELEGITSPCCLLIGQYPHHMTLCLPVAIVKCYGIHL